MRKMGSTEARRDWSRLLDGAERGEPMLITRHGKAVALMVPAGDAIDQAKVNRAVEGLLGARRGVTLGGLKLKDLVDSGRP